MHHFINARSIFLELILSLSILPILDEPFMQFYNLKY